MILNQYDVLHLVGKGLGQSVIWLRVEVMTSINISNVKLLSSYNQICMRAHLFCHPMGQLVYRWREKGVEGVETICLILYYRSAN